MNHVEELERLSRLIDQLLRMSQGGTILNTMQLAEDMVWACGLASKAINLDRALRDHPVNIAKKWQEFYFKRIIEVDKTDGVKAEAIAEINAMGDLMAYLRGDEAPLPNQPAQELMGRD